MPEYIRFNPEASKSMFKPKEKWDLSAKKKENLFGIVSCSPDLSATKTILVNFEIYNSSIPTQNDKVYHFYVNTLGEILEGLPLNGIAKIFDNDSDNLNTIFIGLIAKERNDSVFDKRKPFYNSLNILYKDIINTLKKHNSGVITYDSPKFKDEKAFKKFSFPQTYVERSFLLSVVYARSTVNFPRLASMREKGGIYFVSPTNEVKELEELIVQESYKILQASIEIMRLTVIGNKLWQKYSRGEETDIDIYIKMGVGKGTSAAGLTFPNIKATQDNNTFVYRCSEHTQQCQTFDGLNISKSLLAGRRVSLIAYSEFEFSIKDIFSTSANPLAIVSCVETVYHEIKAHIDLKETETDTYKVSRELTGAELDHSLYGAAYGGVIIFTGTKLHINPTKDRTKPAVLFAQQLLEVSENQIDKWNQIVEKCIGKELKSQTNENK